MEEKKIKLYGGKIVLIDSQDFEYLNRWKWALKLAQRGGFISGR